jgi:hypothetical protein
VVVKGVAAEGEEDQVQCFQIVLSRLVV